MDDKIPAVTNLIIYGILQSCRHLPDLSQNGYQFINAHRFVHKSMSTLPHAFLSIFFRPMPGHNNNGCPFIILSDSSQDLGTINIRQVKVQ